MTEAQILNRMMALCSRREHSTGEIADKIEALKKKGADDIDAGKIISQLCAEKYIDDARYAAAFVRDRSSLAGWGAVKIRYHLRAKGFSDAQISEALEQADLSAAERRMTEVLGAKYRLLKGDDEQARFMKLCRFGASRGYTYDQIKRVYDNIRTDKRD